MFKSENKEIKKKILNDKRFKIDRYTFENHLNLSKILFYKVKKIKLDYNKALVNYRKSYLFKRDYKIIIKIIVKKIVLERIKNFIIKTSITI